MDLFIVKKEDLKCFTHILTESYYRLLLEDKEIIAAGAAVHSSACGIALYTWQSGIIEILYLAVEEKYRRCLIATKLIRFIQRSRFINRGIMRFRFFSPDEYSVWKLFFESMDDFKVSKIAGGDYEIPYAGLDSIVSLPHVNTDTSEILPFEKLTPLQKNQFWTDRQEKGYYFQTHYSMYRNEYVPELTICRLIDNQIAAAVFFQMLNETDLCLRHACCTKEGRQSFLKLFSIARDYIFKQYGTTGSLFVSVSSPASDQLLHTLVPGARTLSCQYEAVSIFPDEWDILPETV